MKNIFPSVLFITIILITITSCSKIPSIQEGGMVSKIYKNKAELDDGKDLHLIKKEIEESTTIILVRHAEKMKDQKDPNLTEKGQIRATKLKDILSGIQLDKIYSTDFNRTQQTASPTAKAQKIEITNYQPFGLKDFGKKLQEEHSGKNILVVGHSNTTPKLLNIFLNETVVESIDESDYTNLFVINIDKKGNAKSLLLRF